MTRNPVKSAGRWIARTVVVVLLSIWMTPAVAAAAGESYQKAQTLLATDPPAAAAMLDRLARIGEFRAQLALGILLIEGRGVPQDRSLGLAFLKLGATDAYVVTDPKLGPKTRETLQHYELQLTGSELLKAEQLAAEITAERDRSQSAALQAKLVPYTQEKVVRTKPGIAFANDTVRITVPSAATDNPPMVIGCALDRRSVVGSCTGAPAPGAPGHCSGEIGSHDTPATAMSARGNFPMPELPPKLRRSGLEGTARFLAHVDSSGYVCSAIMTASSGYPEFDRSALAEVRMWRFAPATKGGAPVEALHEFASSFRTR
jgi:TonB family protein